MGGRRQFLDRFGRYSVGAIALSLAACDSDSRRSSPTKPLEVSGTMKLESPFISPNDLILMPYTCDGKDLSPPLQWHDPPSCTQSFALICDDPDTPFGTFVHWVLFDIPADVRQLPEGLPNQAKLSNRGTQGKSDFGKLGYGGPCPPGGIHRYFFKLYALDRQLDLDAGVTKAKLIRAMEGHILAQAELIGRYTRRR
jgi:Raf kinase inhibitor-like YbhB/YbcL family protein